MDFDKGLVVLDTPEGVLQQFALDLVEQHFCVHYVNDCDEAKLVGAEVGDRLGAVIIACSPGGYDAVRVAEHLRVTPTALIPAGTRPPEPAIAALANAGVRWHLWDGADDAARRFVIESVLSQGDPDERRQHIRVPTQIAAQVEAEGSKADVLLMDVSLGGAGFSGRLGAPVGDHVELCVSIADVPLELPARVAWRRSGQTKLMGLGGLTFLDQSPDAVEVLHSFVRAELRRHAVFAAGE